MKHPSSLSWSQRCGATAFRQSLSGSCEPRELARCRLWRGSSERELKGPWLNRLRPPVSRSTVPDEPPGTRTHAKHRPSWPSAFGAGLETRLRVRRTNLPHDLMSPALGDFFATCAYWTSNYYYYWLVLPTFFIRPTKRKESFAKQIKAGPKRKESFGMAKVSFR